MTQSSRDTILNKLRQGRPSTQWTNASKAKQNPDMPFTEEQLLQQFSHLLKDNHAEIISTTKNQWAQHIAEQGKQRGIKQWLIANTPELIANFQHATIQADYDCQIQTPDQLSPKQEDSKNPYKEYKQPLFNKVDAAITETNWGIAETGTLVIWPTEQAPRLLSLVPPIHYALFRRSTLHATFDVLLDKEQWSKQALPSNILLISGPSKTADIQQTLAYGAHGPKQLIVVIINDL